MPIVSALGNNLLAPHHWAEIKSLLNMDRVDFVLEERQFTLGQLI